MFAGIFLESKSILLEKNSRPGKKLLIAGSGRCNITHTGNVNDFFYHYGDHYRFLKTALLEYSNQDLLDFFHQSGLQTIIDKNGKVFPQSESGSDVLKVLLKNISLKPIEIRTHSKVESIEKVSEGFLIRTTDSLFLSDYLIIATGGKSYPGTGSTGDGYHFAEKLGHTIITPTPALTPVFIKDYSFSELAGVSLDKVKISLYRNQKKIKEHSGDIGFTHNGLSGPGILDFSRFISDNDILKVNFTGENPEVFRKKFIEAVAVSGKKTLLTYLKQYLLPKSLIKELLFQLKIDTELNLAMTDKKTRDHLVDYFCEYTFMIDKKGGYSVAMVTAGGDSLDEVEPEKMQSSLVENLYFVGEVLDIDGDTGGYNLQAAFSTAYLAAKSINSASFD